MKEKKVIIFDLWETLVFGTKDSAISVFYNNITGEKISQEQLKNCMLIRQSEPRLFLEKFLNIVTPSNISSVLLSLKNPKSPLYKKIIRNFRTAIRNDSQETRWLPGAIELLELLRRDKYVLVLVSNLWAYQKKYLFKNLSLNKYFDRCLFSCDLGMNKNQILKNIPKILPIDLRNTVFIGRSYEYDIIPAVNANIRAIRLMTKANNIISPEGMKSIIEEELDYQARNLKKRIITGKQKQNRSLIVIPPFYKLLGSHNSRINLSASYLSAYLSARGYFNRIYHCDSKLKESYITRYQMVFNSIDFYANMETEKSYKEFEDYYKENTFQTVFVTCGDILNPSFDSGNWDSTKRIAKIVRKVNPKAYIIATGPEIGIESEDFDLLVHGEIENLVDKIIEQRVRGRISGSLLSENDLKNFPIFEIKNMATDISPLSLDTIIWRRGCKGTCDFCRVAQINRGIIRYRSIESVLEEIKVRYDALNLTDFYLVDASFTSDKELAIGFCRKLRKEFPDITWRTESRFDTLDKELLAEMKKAGCTHIKLGLENALHEKHQVKTKKVNLDNAGKWIREIQQDIGISCVIYLMLGGKWFTHEQYKQMYENTETLNANGYTVSLFTPYPNTPAGISYEEWRKRKFTGSHLDIRLIDFWKIPLDVINEFFSLELRKGREDKNIRDFV